MRQVMITHAIIKELFEIWIGASRDKKNSWIGACTISEVIFEADMLLCEFSRIKIESKDRTKMTESIKNIRRLCSDGSNKAKSELFELIKFVNWECS